LASDVSVIMTMRDELLENFGVKVSRNLNLRRNPMVEETSDYVVISGSNAKSLGEVLHTNGKKVIQLTKKGMKVGPSTIDNLYGGKYHVDGQLKLASAKQIRKILQKFLPVLQLLKKSRKIILVPLPRYVCMPCCQAVDHCTNRTGGTEGGQAGAEGGLP
jgi:hypothetical protein